jgi:hypothetical protein
MPDIKLRSRRNGLRKLTPEQRRLTADFIEWALVRLIGTRLSKNVEIQVIFDGGLYAKEKTYGYAMWEDRHRHGRAFTLEVDSTFSYLNVLHTVAHELVHVKQWATGEYYASLREEDVWIYQKARFDVKENDYWEYPWEIEAHGRAIGLVIMWLKERELKSAPWARQPITLG